MGELIGIAFLLFIGWGFLLMLKEWFDKLSGGISKLVADSGRGPASSQQIRQADFGPEKFRIKVAQKRDEFGDETVNWVEIAVTGSISAPADNYPIRYIIRAEDVTEGAGNPQFILSMIDELQEDSTTMFLAQLPQTVLPYQSSVLRESLDLIRIPLPILQFARKGTRRLKLTVDVVSANKPPEYAYNKRLDTGESILLETASATVSVEQVGRGYKDDHDARDKVEELTIHLAVLVSAVDGKVDRAEGAVVQAWAKKRIARFENDPDYHEKEKQRLNGYIKYAMSQLSNPKAQVQGVAGKLKGVGQVGDLYDALELCLHVAKADGEAHPEELAFIRALARSLDLDLERVQEMVQSHLPAVMHVDKSSPEAMLGIPAGASPQEAKKILMQQYRKWSALESHSDSAKREQAKEMITLIGKLRQKYG